MFGFETENVFSAGIVRQMKVIKSQELRNIINDWFNSWDFPPNFYNLSRLDDMFRFIIPTRMFYDQLYDIIRREADR